ncbi:MAG: hypothetical protein V4643_07175 [Bacteroidota bacterium]
MDCKISFSEQDLIGGNGNWNVYQVVIDDIPRIIKKCGSLDGKKVDSNIQNFKLVKNIGLPTLSFLEKYHYKNEFIIIGEHLNCNEDKIYVSPNSISILNPNSYSNMTGLEQLLKSENEIRWKHTGTAEKFRNTHKLHSILNFEKFIYKIKTDIKKATSNFIYIYFDSYFWGSDKQNTISELSYKIADFDNIEKCENTKFSELYNANIEEMKISMRSFLQYFVDENKSHQYIEKLK